MDREQLRPRYFAGSHQNSAAPAPASSHARVAKESEADIPFIKIMAQEPTKKLDFAAGAKAYKKRRFQGSLAHGAKIGIMISLCAVVAIGGFGFWLNKTYSGRALPFSYVGGISVGGLTEAQIKTALDNRTKELKVTFVEGGFTRTVPASAFGAKFDTAKAARQITPDFNPFAFLDRRSIEVPVQINDYQVDGYMRVYIHPSQTKPSDAQIVKEKNKLVLKPQITGFRSDPAFAVKSIKMSLSGLNDAVINVGAATLKPSIAEKDLTDDLARANSLLGTNVSVSYGRSMNIVTPAQKLAWMQFDTSFGTKDLTVSFSRTQIRQYVLDLAKKYQKTVQVATAAPSEGQALSPVVQNLNSIENIEEVTDAIATALNSGQSTAQKFIASNDKTPQPVAATASQAVAANTAR